MPDSNPISHFISYLLVKLNIFSNPMTWINFLDISKIIFFLQERQLNLNFSDSGLTPVYFNPVYCASKFGLVGYHYSLAVSHSVTLAVDYSINKHLCGFLRASMSYSKVQKIKKLRVMFSANRTRKCCLFQ